MRSLTTRQFRKLFNGLPPEVQERAKQAYRIWRSDPYYPSLFFRQVHPQQPIFSVRIGLNWRAVALVENNTATWFWIGSHSDYDQLLSQA